MPMQDCDIEVRIKVYGPGVIPEQVYKMKNVRCKWSMHRSNEVYYDYNDPKPKEIRPKGTLLMLKALEHGPGKKVSPSMIAAFNHEPRIDTQLPPVTGRKDEGQDRK